MRRYLPSALAWAGLIAYVAIADEWLNHEGRALMTTGFRALRKNEWGKPVAYGALAGLVAHLLDLP